MHLCLRNDRFALPPETRVEMIRQTSEFLTRALDEDLDLPRIPRRRADQGGFASLMHRPETHLAICNWWLRTLDHLQV